MNQYESAAFKAGFEDAGLEVIATGNDADIVVINTCAVTGNAGAQSRQSIRKALRNNPLARIVITGCYAELCGEDFKKEKTLQDRDYLVIGNSKKDKLVDVSLDLRASSPQLIMGKIRKAEKICHLPVKRFGQRSRAYLRIQDGCESYCSYCIVPFTRGPNRSLPVTEVLQQAQIFAEAGHREIVLTGIHLGFYGRDLQPFEDIVSLLDKLTRTTPHTLYRISSLEPLEITDELLMLMKERTNIQPHLHIPLQSGHDAILKKMNRRYTTAQFKEVISRCRQQIPDLAIGIDILAGFPGETDEFFSQARKFLEELDFTYLHVFPYSVRPGTQAALYQEQVAKSIKDTRVAILRDLSENKRKSFYSKHLGQTRTVLVEGQRDEKDRLKGFTDNYIAVRFKGPDSLLNSLAHVHLISLRENYIIGERITPHES